MRVVSNLRNLFAKSQAFKTVGIYTGITFFSKAISFLLLLVYTQPRFITPGENGLLNLFSSSVLFLMPFLAMGILHSTSTEFFKLPKEEFRNFFTTNLVLPSGVMLLSCLGFFIFRESLQANYDFPIEFIFLIPLVTFLTYINEQLIVLLRSSQELKKYVITGIVRIILEFGLSVVLVVFVAMHWKGRLTGILAANLVLGLYAFYYFREKGYLSGRFNPKYVKSELLYAIPVAAMQLSIFALSSSDKFILAKLADSNEVVGIYSVACIFASVITIFSSAYLSYLFPSIYKILSEKPVNTTFIKRNFFQFVTVMVGVTLLLMVSVPFIYRNFINERYHSAINYYYFIILGYFTWGITFFFYSFLLYHKHKRKILLLSFLSIASTLTCTYFLTKAYGPRGSAMAMFFNSTIMLGMTLVMVRKHIHKVFFEKPAMT